MKILPINSYYNKNARNKYKKSNNIDISFQAKYKAPKLSISGISDRSVGTMQSKISKMLQFLNENSKRQSKGIENKVKSFLGSFFLRKDSELKKDYIISGKIWFVQDNIETFRNLVEIQT